MAAASAAARKRGLSTFRVLGGNMAPALDTGEVVWFEEIKHAELLQRGQIVAFRSDEFGEAMIPSRVIGFAGETVQLRDGDLLINDIRVPEPYLQTGRAEQDYSRDSERALVPDDCVWLLGDFRDMSKDSRSFGPLPIKCVIGRITQVHALGDHASPRRAR
jgi:signal peptidase I